MNNIYDIALSLTPRIGGRTAMHLIERCFSAENIFSLPLDRLIALTGLTESVALSIVNRVAFKAAEAELNHCAEHGINAIAMTDDHYPTLLRECYNPPFIIYVQGDYSVLTHNMVSVVGTRRISNYGGRVCDQLIHDMAKKIHNLVIVSGLAYGVDAASHRAALDSQIPTVAVLPCAFPNIQPAAHKSLSRSIIDSGGALITEYHSRTRGGKNTFVARNKIIAGISSATIVVESSMEGGGMHTARFAGEENRAVFAVPGRIYDDTSQGCNFLIRTLAANPIICADDLIRDLNWEDRLREQIYSPLFGVEGALTPEREGGYPDAPLGFNISQLSPDQLAVMRSMTSNDPLQIEVIGRLCGLPIQKLSVLLLELELMGVVKAIPGARYERLVSISSLQ